MQDNGQIKSREQSPGLLALYAGSYFLLIGNRVLPEGTICNLYFSLSVCLGKILFTSMEKKLPHMVITLIIPKPETEAGFEYFSAINCGLV